MPDFAAGEESLVDILEGYCEAVSEAGMSGRR